MMTILFMVLVTIFLSLTFVGCYLWSLSSGQYDDLVTPAMRILFDESIERTERNLNEDNRAKK